MGMIDDHSLTRSLERFVKVCVKYNSEILLIIVFFFRRPFHSH